MNSKSFISIVFITSLAAFAMSASATTDTQADTKPEDASAKHGQMKMKPHNHMEEKMGTNAPRMMPADDATAAKEKTVPEKKDDKKEDKKNDKKGGKHDHAHDGGKT